LVQAAAAAAAAAAADLTLLPLSASCPVVHSAAAIISFDI
jgi:hypothetical protein